MRRAKKVHTKEVSLYSVIIDLSARRVLPLKPCRDLEPLLFEAGDQFSPHGGVDPSSSEQASVRHPEIDHRIEIRDDQNKPGER